MLVSEFHGNNVDVLLEPIKADRLYEACTDGAAFFMVDVPKGGKPIHCRNVLRATWAVPVGASPTERYVTFLCLTGTGRPKLQTVYPSELDGPDACRIVYRAAPMAPDDPRRGKPWHGWPVP